MSQSKRSGFSILLRLICLQPRTLITISALSLLASLLLAPVPFIGKIIIDQIIFKGGAATAAAGGWFGIPTNLWMLAALVLVSVMLKLLSGIITSWQAHYGLQISRNVLHDLRLQVALHLAGAKQSFFETMAPSRIGAIMTLDISRIDATITAILGSLVSAVFMFVVIVALMITLNPLLACIILITMPFTAMLCIFAQRIARDFSLRESDRHTYLNTNITEFFSGIKMIRVFNAEPFFLHRFLNLAEEHRYEGILNWSTYSIINNLISWFGGLGADVFLLVGGIMALRGQITFGTFFAFYGCQAMLWGPVNTLLNATQTIQAGSASAEKVMELQDTSVETYLERDTNIRVESLRGEITLEQVGFCYHEDEPILRDVTFSIAPGSMTALVGQTGSGKSTLANLLTGLYLPTSGSLKVDGLDVRHWDLQALRSEIGVVLQDHFLFDATIRVNLTLGRDGYTDDQLWDALKAAHLVDHVHNLPERLDTRVGVGGSRLSGGQKQRLAIARVFLKNPKLLILDEATSALDTETERAIQSSFEVLSQGRTSVVIAHRLSTIYRADQIAVLHQGRLVEIGNHDTLICEDHSLYRKLYEAQVKGMIPLSGAHRNHNL